ncbi:hypothetical protein Ancab_005265 [Ancistrocladus abbreviatus]
MENSSSSIQALVSRIKERVTHLINGNNSNNYIGVQSFVSPSAYDTAWLAMVADPRQPDEPMFKACLDWVLDNQNPAGFWGQTDWEGFPTIDSLPATLACMIALKTWNLGHQHIQKGMAFISAHAAIILKDYGNSFPRWFTIIFPGMIELAKKAGMEVSFLHEIEQINGIFDERSKILQREQIKICTVHQLQRLGLSGYFNEEIKQLLEQVYREILLVLE